MRDVSLREFLELLRQMPVMVEIHPLSLAFLPEGVRVFHSAWSMAAELDTPIAQPVKPMLAAQVEPALQHRLPVVRCLHNPLTTELNQVLLRRYDLIKGNTLWQSQVADQIVQRTDAEVVVLMLVDGLSYADLTRYAGPCLASATPVLVDGVSNTNQGMVRIVGNPPLAQRLFDVGFRTCFGFTYWERAEEPLTDRIFASFGDRVWKVKAFEEVLAVLQSEDVRGAFVQIVRTGLDSSAHQHRERPNIAATVVDIVSDFERLGDLLARRDVSAWLHVVSDHGILWAHEHTLQAYEFGGTGHPRYYEHAKRGEHVLTVEFEGKEFALLGYPYLRRELRANEWGVHGGLSFEESIVGWLSRRIDRGKELRE